MSDFSSTQETRPFHFDRWEQATVTAALIHYALAIADPAECVNCLNKLCPAPQRRWDELIYEARANLRNLQKLADEEVAAMQEP